MDVPSQRQVRQTLRSIGGAIAAVIALVAAIATVAPAAQGALPGANGKIAFVIDGDIFVMRSDGANETRLTSDSADDFSPAFSPDGSRIVFSRYPGGIFVSGETQLTDDRGYYEQTPAFSADGSKIAWAGVDPRTGNNDIFIMNADGSNPVQLTKHPSADSSDPVFSSEISVINADGTDETRLTDDSDLRSDRTPVFSPDGSKIAYTSSIRDPLIGGNSRTGIFVMNADGSGVMPLRDDQACEATCGWQMSDDPAWQPCRWRRRPPRHRRPHRPRHRRQRQRRPRCPPRRRPLPQRR